MITKTGLKALLEEHKIAPIKRLGQNFLIDKSMRDKIIREAEITRDDDCLEIGPGTGALTEGLCRASRRVVAVEIDKGMYELLKKTLAYRQPPGTYVAHDNLALIHGDILKTDTQNALKAALPDGFKLVANLPYYITTPILMEFLTGGYHVKTITVMLQKEVGERLCASPGSKAYGSLSIAARAYSEIKPLFDVPRECFYPRPDVESSVIRLEVLAAPRIQEDDKELFFKIVRAGFSSRRKTLVNCLSSSGMLDKEAAKRLLAQMGIDELRRGETLGIDEYLTLTREVKTLNALY